MDARDLDLKYRPRTLDDVVGQDPAVKAIRAFGKNVPRCILLHGPSGTGKTTISRIIARMQGVEGDSMDFQEVNCGLIESPIAWVRDLRGWTGQGCVSGTKRVWILDECQTLSRQKGAQEGLLKIFEDSPPHNQFFLCTTDPKRILKTVVGRCVEVGLRALKPAELKALVVRVAVAEGCRLDDEVCARIVENANGGARDAIKGLQKVIGIASVDDQLAALGGFGDSAEAFALAKAVIYSSKPSWGTVAKILTDLVDEDPEGLRLMLMAAARTTLLKGGANAAHAYKVIVCLEKPFYDKSSGRPLLCAACYEIVNGK